MRCQRCGKESNTWIMSMFNTDMICMECKEKEKQHPAYKSAVDAENREVLRGNFRYRGIGKPSDL